MKRKSDQPIKSENPKVTAIESKSTKGPSKPAALETAGTFRKPAEIKKPAEEKPPPGQLESPLKGGHYELNARMTKMVETELQDIMIKVWQELPDNPTDEAEALVVDKLRNQAGDDLRNVLGLNITKRLLNVHNPLYVKVQFSGKPEKVHLGEFLKKYNFTAFKRIEKTVNMFAAQVKTINDFDRICSCNDIRCGDIKVTVNPIYKFTKCPPNLVTGFSEDDAASDETSTETDDIKVKIRNEEAASKPENVPTKPKPEDSKNENSKPVANKNVANKPAVENKTGVEKPAIKSSVENKTQVTKPPADLGWGKVVENKTVANKTAVKKPATETPVSKPAVQNNTPTNKTVNNRPATNNTTVAKSTVVSKPAAVNKSQVETKANLTKPSPTNKELKKLQVTPKTNTGKKPVTSPVKQLAKPKTDDKAKTNKVESDYDVLDDHDILALMSEGIVLDECSGSDDE